MTDTDEIEQLRDRVAELEERLDDAKDADDDQADDGGGWTATRRATLASLLGLGGIGAAAGRVAAQSGGNGAACTWLGDQNASGYGLYQLGLLALADSGTSPSADGEIRLNNGDVEIHSGGSVRNISNTGSGVLGDSGTDTSDGGDIYQFPQVEDALDLQGGGEIQNAEAVQTRDSVTVTEGEATDTLHYGSAQDRANAGDESVALGIGARANGDDGSGGSISRHVAVGYQAAQNNTGNALTASGYLAAQNNTGNKVTASGYLAARDNTGFGVTAAGYEAARDNTGSSVTASGFRAAQSNTGNSVTGSGRAAAQNNTGDRVTASGFAAAQNNTGNRVTASGYQAARGDGLSDPTTMGDDNIGIGESAIRNNQASGLIAIGQDAGINAQTDDQLIITQRDGTRRMVMDLTTGDLSITGTLTENATL